jgi:copper chaperone CopZ
MNTSKLISLAAILCFVIVLIACKGKNTNVSANEKKTASTVEISIKGMSCTGCEQTIQTGIASLNGIQSVKATFTDGKAVVVYLPGKTDTVKMKEVITGKGYIVNKFTQLPSAEVTN